MSSPQESSTPFHWHDAEFDDSNFQIRGRTLFFMVILFSIILSVTFMFLYARRIFRFGPPPPVTTSPVHSAHPPPPPPQGLDPITINNLPTVLCKGNSSESECCICLGIFLDGDTVKVLPQCDHRFHLECVDNWLMTQSSCPLCRACLRVDSLV
ncbi:RING-H2 finger protein ATL66 [Forsythia ovata]|uniref:RING-type E3 ubiquitin transferase n=1 Tax=Forsythia ovata TaxID=205694 RepID=A0ABD1WJ87_9LAMI